MRYLISIFTIITCFAATVVSAEQQTPQTRARDACLAAHTIEQQMLEIGGQQFVHQYCQMTAYTEKEWICVSGKLQEGAGFAMAKRGCGIIETYSRHQ